ncbi:MAG: HD-GYP domain-containing protein [Desulfovibrio sp.]|uniref:HD-GYP domain-containing protein n=1 Tax=Desulfovibrio sp. 7SRBS1 TaxID=3378064 RepID=UPI003B40CCE4
MAEDEKQSLPNKEQTATPDDSHESPQSESAASGKFPAVCFDGDSDDLELGEEDVLTADDLAEDLGSEEAVEVSARSIHDEYYQLGSAILEAFPKFCYPIDLYRYNEEASSLIPTYRAGQRMHYSFRSKIVDMCREGRLFVARSQHDIYTSYMTRQLDLVLLDKNLKPNEIAETLFKALAYRLDELFKSPVRESYEKFEHDLNIFVECIGRNVKVIFELICYLHFNNLPENKMVNVAVMGLAIYMYKDKENLSKASLFSVSRGLFLHDIGMCKIPKFITDKEQGLRIDERRRVHEHVQLSVDILTSLGLSGEVALQCACEHHERLDGSGYPSKLRGEKLSLMGRICSVADSYAAMIAEKPYAKGKKPLEAAVALFKDQKKYDPSITSLLMKILQDTSC